MTDDYDVPESGPFCIHWAESGCCDATCDECGHGCAYHGDGSSGCYECDCEGFADND